MSVISTYEGNFEYSAPSPQGTGPLRLLTFDPSATSTSLSLSLVDAEQQHKFFAISYAWDSPVCKPVFGINASVSCARTTHSTPLWTNNKALCNNYLKSHRRGPDGYVNIHIDRQEFYIQVTVYHLLQTLRDSAEIQERLRRGEYFWLDAICVNQNDNFETEQQTSNMHEIYKAAQHVYVWLGITYNRSSVAMDFLSHLSPFKSPQHFVPTSRWRAQSHSVDQYWPLYFLFVRPYWQRIWVIQEFLLARDMTLLCGNKAVPCQKAESLVNQLDIDYEFRKRHPQWAALPGVRVLQARTAYLSSCVKPSLESMIQHFLFSRSTYPEDKIIGLLNVSLSSVQTEFNGEPGSVMKRVGIINKVVADFQGQQMDPQTAQEWQHLLACLLGVRGMLLEPEKSPGPKPHERVGHKTVKPKLGTILPLCSPSLPQSRRDPKTKNLVDERILNPKPENELSQMVVPILRLERSPALPRIMRYPATITSFPEIIIQRQEVNRVWSVTTDSVSFVGNVLSARPASTLLHPLTSRAKVEDTCLSDDEMDDGERRRRRQKREEKTRRRRQKSEEKTRGRRQEREDTCLGGGGGTLVRSGMSTF